MKNAILLKEGKNYAELALYFPEMQQLQKLIDPEDLSPKGFETDPHITLLYGFDDSVVPEDVQKILDRVKISSLKTDKISYFADFGSGEPLKFDIIDPEIMNLNKLLQALPHPSTTHEYRPHVTIAYLKEGRAKKYVEDPRFSSLTFDLKPKEAKYSKNKVKTKLNLNEQSNTQVMDKILNNWNNFLNEQTEPFQKKVKQGYVKDRNQYLKSGKGKPSKPFDVEPSKVRAKSAPPIGESSIEEVYEIDEGLFNDLLVKMGMSKEPEKKQEYTNYNEVYKNIYVGAAPIKGGKLIDSLIEDGGFIRIFIMSNESANIIKNQYKDERDIPATIVLDYAIEDTENPTQEEIQKLNKAGLLIKGYARQGKVLVTCNKGLNRSSTAACLAMTLLGVKPEEAIQKVQKARGEQALTLNGRPHEGFIPIILGSKKTSK